ncbi:MAG: LytR C-terminal domain-containing protein [Actinomycetota bacterium]|nr:LytR C-terminal domain-containing protein [Actinomycetota bacterium]
MNGPMSRPNNAATIRGLLLVIVAVAVGVYLLRGTDTPTLDTASTPTSVASAQEEAATEQEETVASTETTLPGIVVATSAPENGAAPDDSDAGTMVGFEGRPNEEVSVQVANSTTVRGAAGQKTDFLKTKGFIIKTPINMKGTALDRTRVHHQPGSIIEAQNIALLLGLDDQNDVYKMPTDLSAYDGYDEPHVLIALGIDKASAD